MNEVTGQYDYIIVGSGAGGGPLAGNLARAGQKVLLLEAGGSYEGFNYQVPAFHALATEDQHLRWNYFVRHYTDDKQQLRDCKFIPECNGVLYPRAGTLGGCTAHNAMITVYPHNSDWDEIARITGDSSWESKVMRRYFERLEHCHYIREPLAYPRNRFLLALLRAFPWLSHLFDNPSRHGFHGWLSTNMAHASTVIEDQQLLNVIHAAAKDTLAETLGRRLTIIESLDGYFDPNDWRVQAENQQGLWLTPIATDRGKRCGTREYIRRVQQSFPDDLIVKTHTLVTKVLFDEEDTRRAIGVEYLEGKHLYRADPYASKDRDATGLPRRVFANKEVILAAGAFNTPQLLMLSGIGPCQELQRLDIDVRVDLPGVGENLQDRYEVGIVYEMNADFPILSDLTFAPPLPGQPPDPGFLAWLKGEGLYTTNGVAIGVIKKSQPARALPDLYIFGLPSSFQGYFPGYSHTLETSHNYFTWAILKAHTQNTGGRITLNSSDPRDVPEINFHYFREGNDKKGEDLQAVVSGIEFVRHMMQHAGAVVCKEVVPGENVRTYEQIEQFVMDQAWGHHASCTCRMGSGTYEKVPDNDPMAVVDSKFRVYGTRNLRVVDASVFPRIPGFFIVTSVYMISEKASDVILTDAQEVYQCSPKSHKQLSVH